MALATSPSSCTGEESSGNRTEATLNRSAVTSPTIYPCPLRCPVLNGRLLALTGRQRGLFTTAWVSLAEALSGFGVRKGETHAPGGPHPAACCLLSGKHTLSVARTIHDAS